MSIEAVELLQEQKLHNPEWYRRQLAGLSDDQIFRRGQIAKVFNSLERFRQIKGSEGTVFKCKERFISFLMREEGLTKLKARKRWDAVCADDSVPKRTDKYGRKTCPIELDYTVTDEQVIRGGKRRRVDVGADDDGNSDEVNSSILQHRPSLTAEFVAPEIGRLMDRRLPFAGFDGEDPECALDLAKLWDSSVSSEQLTRLAVCTNQNLVDLF